MKLKKMLNGVDCDLTRIPDLDVKHISYDSRTVTNGSLFIAINGYKDDGHKFIPDAVKKGASAVIADCIKMPDCNVPVISVDNTRKAMSIIAKNYYSNPSEAMTIIGITGTNGKSTTTSMLNHILNSNGMPSGSLGTLGFTTPHGITSTGFTTPEALELNHLLRTLKDSNIFNTVMEVSSHALSLNRVDDINFDVAIFTNLGEDHLDFHKNKANYLNSKKILFQKMSKDKVSIVNIDDNNSKDVIKSTKSRVVTYSTKKNADFSCYNTVVNVSSIESKIIYKGLEYDFFCPVVGSFNLSNALAAIAASVNTGVNIQDAISCMKSFKGTPGRLELIREDSDSGTIFIDYAHTPDAFNNVLSTMNKVGGGRKIITIFGCGGDRDRSKRPKMANIAEKYSSEVIATSDNPRNENIDSILNDIESGFILKKHKIIKNRTEAIEFALSKMNNNTILLILGKGRENYQLVNGRKNYHNDLEIINTFYENRN